jgi:hypothetical protein
VYLAVGCGKGKKKGLGNNNPAAADQGNVIQRMVGNDVETSPYSPSGDQQVQKCDELNCNFDSGCCWSNNQPPADEINWVKASGQGEAAKLQKSFGTSQQPDGGYLLTASEVGGNSEQTAQMYSCQVCSGGSVTVKVRHWQSKSMSIMVCQIHDLTVKPSNCQTLPSTSGNVDTVQLPQDQSSRIAIIAKGFTDPAGSVAMIDDVSVECDQCQDTTTQPPATPAPAPAPPAATEAPAAPPCKEIVCNFEQGNPCAYSPASGGGNANQNWGTQQAPYQNRLTGIPKAGEGQKFAACYLKKAGEKSTLQTNANFDKDYVVRFNYYKATEGVNLKACCDDESNCPYGATPDVQTSDYRSWKTASITCKAGTKKVLFISENEKGESEGACGIDNIQLLQPSGGSPDDASQSACAGKS